MTIYLKYWNDGTIEIIYIKSGWRKKRFHFLINPQDVAQVLSLEGEINHESVTHIVALETPFSDEIWFNKVAEISEWLNKPIITYQEHFPVFRSIGVPIGQLRAIETLDGIFQEIDFKPIRYTKMRFDPKNERVEPTIETKKPMIEDIVPDSIYGFVGIALRPFQFLAKLIFSTFNRKINPLEILPLTKNRKKQKSNLEGDIPEKSILLECTFKETKILLPLDDIGRNRLLDVIQDFNPEILVSWDLNLAELFSFPEGPKKMLLLDSKYFKEEPTFIPRAFNPQLPFDVILSGKNQWVELT